MIDRHGRPICIGYARHELIWIEAALSLPRIERRAALQDIADMTGRGYENIRAMAARMDNALEEQARNARRIVVPARAMPKPRALAPSALSQPTRAHLMGAR
jgi:hypothetical protein